MVVTHSLADSQSLVGPPYLNNKKITNNYYHCFRSMHSKGINIYTNTHLNIHTRVCTHTHTHIQMMSPWGKAPGICEGIGRGIPGGGPSNSCEGGPRAAELPVGGNWGSKNGLGFACREEKTTNAVNTHNRYVELQTYRKTTCMGIGYRVFLFNLGNL